MKKYLFSDLDGTLMLEKDLTIPGIKIPKHNLEEILEFTKRGNEFIVATGRPHFSVIQLFEQNKISGYNICENGMIVAKNEEILFYENTNFFDYEIAIKYALLNNIQFIGFTKQNNQAFINNNYKQQQTQKRIKKYANIYKFKDISNVLFEDIIHLTFLFENQEQKNSTIKILNEKMLDSKIISTTTDAADVVNKDVNKLKAIKKFMETENILECQVGYVGDGLNDLECLNYFKNSYVMKNATVDLLNNITNDVIMVNSVKEAIKKFNGEENEY